jgi:hypothetical protein
MLEGKYAVTVKEISKMLKLGKTRTKWYVAELKRDDVIYTRYKTGNTAHYALRREK